jgi:glucose/arabinose dehydrogenase
VTPAGASRALPRWVPVLAGVVAAAALSACADGGRPPRAAPSAAAPSPTVPADTHASDTPASDPSASQAPVRAAGKPRVEVLASGLEVPWDLAFLPDGRMLVTERPGRVRLVEADGTVQDRPAATVEVSAQGEGGLLGIDLDPQFVQGQPFAYLFATTRQGLEVQRWRVATDGTMSREAVVLGGIRAGRIHDSGRLRFGPDAHLYVVTGDAGQGPLAQDPRSLNGKVLRLSPEQYRATTDRPEIFSIGHRNPQGLDWQPGSDRLVITDHGPSGFDGPSCCDEVDVVVRDGNYGWPQVFGRDHGRFRAPAMLWQRTIAPSGAAFVTLPGSSWTGSYVVAALRGRNLHRLSFTGDRVTGEQVLLDGRYGRLRAVVEGPDGALYVTTSNRDGRGEPAQADDRVLRIVPPAG